MQSETYPRPSWDGIEAATDVIGPWSDDESQDGLGTADGNVEQAAFMPMTREEAYANCPSDSYVELYSSEWLVVPFVPVEHPPFMCLPGDHRASRQLASSGS